MKLLNLYYTKYFNELISADPHPKYYRFLYTVYLVGGSCYKLANKVLVNSRVNYFSQWARRNKMANYEQFEYKHLS